MIIMVWVTVISDSIKILSKIGSFERTSQPNSYGHQRKRWMNWAFQRKQFDPCPDNPLDPYEEIVQVLFNSAHWLLYSSFFEPINYPSSYKHC